MNWSAHTSAITTCAKCPRLREHCEKIAHEKRKAFAQESYWGKPVPAFGVSDARLVIIGLAPAAHGANRTGRMFTGDRSGEWLYRALHKAGFANQASSVSRDDGLELHDAFITAVARCAPPDNKPTPKEIANCHPFLKREIENLKNARVYLALGKLAFDQTWNLLCDLGMTSGFRPKFSHGVCVKISEKRSLLASYHPSQQNTFTKKLTEPMFDSVFNQAKLLTQS